MCDLEGQPDYMYLKVPTIELNEDQEEIYQEHLKFWEIWDDFEGNLSIPKHFAVYMYYRSTFLKILSTFRIEWFNTISWCKKTKKKNGLRNNKKP